MSQSEIPQELFDLFSWNPPTLKQRSGKESSTRTKPPGFFDKHVNSKLILKRIILLPTLVRDITGVVDNALSALSENNIQLPPSEKGLMTVDARKAIVRLHKATISSEIAVADFYHLTTVTFCLPVASTLALHPRAEEWGTLLTWTKSTDVSGYAIADGFLSFINLDDSDDETNAARAQLVEAMDEAIRQKYNAMVKFLLLDSLASWEHKILAAGGFEVMLEIPNLPKQKFPWTKCRNRLCRKIPKHIKQLERVKLVQVRDDAKDPPWDLGGYSSDILASTPAVPQPSLPSGDPLHLPIAQKRKRDDDGNSRDSSTDRMPPPALPTRILRSYKGKEVDRSAEGQGDDIDNDIDDNVYVGRHSLTAQHLIQQAWAQAVRIDGTIIVLQAGNYEYIGIRHRKTQTLYLSDLIEPPTCSNPCYGKLHVGIYMAAVQDAMDRAIQSASKPQPADSEGPSDNEEDGRDGKGGRGEGSSRGGHRGNRGGRGRGNRGGGRRSNRGQARGHNLGDEGGSKAPEDSDQEKENMGGGTGKKATNVTVQETYCLANCQKIAALYLRYDIYDSPNPAIFVRSSLSLRAPPRSCSYYKLEECLTIVLTSEIGRGGIGVVLRGTLWVGAATRRGLLDVAVKLAITGEQRKALWNEYTVYGRLKMEGINAGITTPIGFFEDAEGGASALVMPYAGIPLAMTPKLVVQRSHREMALATLKAIHCTGILHGDLRRENLFMDNSGIIIIDFSHSRKCDDQAAKDKETKQLRSLLGQGSRLDQ